jgi:hypothetical protein
MIQQNIFIVNFFTLYEILDEIKENLSFKIIKYKNLDKLIEDPSFDLKNSLIVSKHKDLPLNGKISKKNVLTLSELPLKVNKIIELINIDLIKIKFNYQSNISIKNYTLNLNSKYISYNNINLKLTEKEIEIILYLNKKEKKQSVLELQKNIWGYVPDMETHTVETHIYRLRKKISDRFKDKNFILSHLDGYSIK